VERKEKKEEAANVRTSRYVRQHGEAKPPPERRNPVCAGLARAGRRLSEAACHRGWTQSRMAGHVAVCARPLSQMSSSQAFLNVSAIVEILLVENTMLYLPYEYVHHALRI